MQFKLKIQMGNDAMLTVTDVAKSLRVLANSLDEHGDANTNAYYPIRDINGNTVGRAKFVAEADDA